LIKFKKKSSKGQGKKTGGSSKGKEDQDKSPRSDKASASTGKGKHKKDNISKNTLCFLYNGTHGAFECSKWVKFTTLVQGEEKQEGERKIASIKLFNGQMKPRWRDNLVGTCTWRLLLMLSHYK